MLQKNVLLGGKWYTGKDLCCITFKMFCFSKLQLCFFNLLKQVHVVKFVHQVNANKVNKETIIPTKHSIEQCIKSHWSQVIAQKQHVNYRRQT